MQSFLHSLADPMHSVFYSCFPHRLGVNVQMMLCPVVQLQTKLQNEFACPPVFEGDKDKRCAY
jgi:hypothetical protein